MTTVLFEGKLCLVPFHFVQDNVVVVDSDGRDSFSEHPFGFVHSTVGLGAVL